MKKGFTLIELLATIVILAIVAVICGSLVLNVIENSKSKDRVLVASKVISTLESYAVNYELEKGVPFINQNLTISNKSIEGIDFSLNGSLPDEGMIHIDENGLISVYLYDGNYCVHGNKNNLLSASGECDYTNNFSLSFSTYNSYSVDKQTLIINIDRVISFTSLNATPYSFDGGTTWQASSSYSTTNSFQNSICVRDVDSKFVCSPYSIYKLNIDASEGILTNMTSEDMFWLEPSTNIEIGYPMKVGYVFDGWTLVGTGSSVNGTRFIMGTTNATLTANWTTGSFTLTVDPNNGTWNGTSPQSIAKNSSVVIEEPVRPGYRFNGWTLDGTGSSINGTTFIMGTANATLTANWLINSYTLTVNPNGGTWSGSTSQTLLYNFSIPIAVPSRVGYTFNGWVVSGAGSSISGTTFTMGTANTTLTASWTANNYTLTVNLNGGTWSGTTPQTIACDSTATIAVPTRAGYIFNDWSLSGTGSSISGTTFTMGNANATLTANWVAEVTTFSYTGGSQTFTVQKSGNYKIELWGAQGKDATDPAYLGGKGGYTSGTIYLAKNENLYVYVGAKGVLFNGSSNYDVYYGGGATDVRLVGDVPWNNSGSLNTRIMVAGGGGGCYPFNYWSCQIAGGLIAGVSAYSGPATQISGAGFGTATSSGGGGYYGGISGGAGGSSYISGHTGCVAITSASSSTPKTGCTTGTTDNSCSIHYSGKVFTNTIMIDGNGYGWTNIQNSYQLMPNPAGGTYSMGVGNSGNGYAKITYIGA